MKNFNNITCPLCGSEKVQYQKSFDVEKIIHEWKIFGIHIREFFFRDSQIQLVMCDNCDLQFFIPVLILETKNLYSQLEKFDWYYMPEKWEHLIALQEIKESEKILEIGSGFGDFIKKVITEKGNVIEGIELNESAVVASQLLGLPVKSIDLSKIVQEFSGQYDAVCSFQVLEHIPNPKEFLDNVCKLLKPGGRLILGLPNADSFLKHQFNVLDMPPHHTTRWSQSTLEKLPEFFPIYLDHIELEPLVDYQVYSYVDAYLSLIAKNIKFDYIYKPKLIHILSKLLILSRLNKLMRGQSMYVSYIRN